MNNSKKRSQYESASGCQHGDFSFHAASDSISLDWQRSHNSCIRTARAAKFFKLAKRDSHSSPFINSVQSRKPAMAALLCYSASLALCISLSEARTLFQMRFHALDNFSSSFRNAAVGAARVSLNYLDLSSILRKHCSCWGLHGSSQSNRRLVWLGRFVLLAGDFSRCHRGRSPQVNILSGRWVCQD